MVTFTCNNCGSSFKKAKVETHFYQCRFSSISCIDCQKDFTMETSKLHNKCFNEDEKYAAGGGSLQAPSVRKGEAKQSNWTDFIHEIFEKTRQKIDTASRNLIQTLLKHDNIPRKKPKFVNFIKSSNRNRFEPQTIENVWTILETEWKKTADINNSKKLEEKSTLKQDEAKNGEPTADLEDNGEENTKKKKKKKKNKHDKNETSTELLLEEIDETTILEEQTEEKVSSKKKKKKKKSLLIMKK